MIIILEKVINKRNTMKMNFQHTLAIVILLVGVQCTVAQKKDDAIGTEVVNVVKPYTPTISDAFKVKETPSFDDEDTNKKEAIQYSIFSFPVASTFTPSKGKAAGVDKSAAEKLYGNYATLAAGNYGTVNAELFITENVSNKDYFGVMLRHLSSQGGIKSALLENKYYNTSLDATYGSKSRKLSWNADLGYQNQIYNWYGLQPDTFDQTTIDAISPKQTYHNFYLGGRVAVGESVFKEATVKFSHFWDAFSSGENRFLFQPQLEADIMGEKLKASFVLDYLSGNFQKQYFDFDGIKYGYTNVGFQPSYQIKQDDLTVNLGAGLFYSVSNEANKNKFYIYPQINATYKFVGDLMIGYAGAEGSLKQNTYHDFVDTNFFVSPTLGIAPTDQKYDIYVGLKGKLANAIGYNIKGSFSDEANKALFKSNEYNAQNTNLSGYAYGNSFGVVYDNVKTISFYGELKADLSKDVAFGLNGTFSSYSMGTEAQAWNLPAMKLATTLDFKITPKWEAGYSVFFVGQRKDQFIYNSLLINTIQDVNLASYLDVNAHLNYKRNERLSFFLKGNNLANQKYQRWMNYPVQGIQILLGANYKFDF